MKIWSDTLLSGDFYAAASKAHAELTEITLGRARKRSRVFTVALSGDSPYMQGTANREPGTKAATWDQWGIFLNALFELDPNMTTQYYQDRETFNRRTEWRFETLTFEQSHRVHQWANAGMGRNRLVCLKCGATQQLSIRRDEQVSA